jgi:hypothetical protein
MLVRCACVPNHSEHFAISRDSLAYDNHPSQLTPSRYKKLSCLSG